MQAKSYLKFMTLAIGVPIVIGVCSFLLVKTVRSQIALNGRRIPVTLHKKESTINFSSGNTFAKEVFTAIAADGSRVSGDESAISLEASTGFRVITSASLAKTVVIDNAVRATTTTFLSPTQVQRLRTLPQDATCQHPSVSAGVKWRVIGFDRILGIDTVVTELRHDGAIQTRWESPRYNCEPMREVEELQDPQTGTITDRFERTVIKIQDGEPDHNLFTLPAYVEMLPSQRTAQNAKIHGHSPEAFTERARRGLQQKDQQYISNLLKPRQRNLWVTDRVE